MNTKVVSNMEGEFNSNVLFCFRVSDVWVQGICCGIGVYLHCDWGLGILSIVRSSIGGRGVGLLRVETCKSLFISYCFSTIIMTFHVIFQFSRRFDGKDSTKYPRI